MKRLQPHIVGLVKEHLKNGLSERQIAKILKCSRNTVAGIRSGAITEQTILVNLKKAFSQKPLASEDFHQQHFL
jgi:transposase